MKFVWIFGPTAVGKDQLIKRIVGDPNHRMITELSLEPQIIPNHSSLSLRQECRALLVGEITKDRSNGNTILIKGQGYDITAGNTSPKALVELNSDDGHILVYLDASVDTLRKRRENRGEANSINDENARTDMMKIAKQYEQDASVSFRWFDNEDEQYPVEISRPGIP